MFELCRNERSVDTFVSIYKCSHLLQNVNNARFTLPTAEIRSGKNVLYVFKKINENSNIKQKKSWEPFRSCLLNSTANPEIGWIGCAQWYSLLTGWVH